MGGETSGIVAPTSRPKGLSPRGRGNQKGAHQAPAGQRSIPAWAGKPPHRLLPLRVIEVYPRVGGETGADASGTWEEWGLSPRGRGNRRCPVREPGSARSIPAWAGKPLCHIRQEPHRTVYPRVGGETLDLKDKDKHEEGLSPRGRGNRQTGTGTGPRSRSIPAWAGKPLRAICALTIPMVYPRVGGETSRFDRRLPAAGGLSPRGRGNPSPNCRRAAADRSIPAWAGKPDRSARTATARAVYPRVGGETRQQHSSPTRRMGLSPRGRGNHSRVLRRTGIEGSIPAWAGKPAPRRLGDASAGVYPRVGGETRRRSDVHRLPSGLSPRGRGNRQPVARGARPLGSIPAWAGKPESTPTSPNACRVYPRVGGETRALIAAQEGQQGLSPRGRGNPGMFMLACSSGGSIPAWAGKPVVSTGYDALFRVYPRVGGETSFPLTIEAIVSGLSPRGRGNPPRVVGHHAQPGSIPAWAGKPLFLALFGKVMRVYPRVGGETGTAVPADEWPEGLSPRGRGNLRTRPRGRSSRRSIPAWAGKPAIALIAGMLPRVYPRVGGETEVGDLINVAGVGLSPRGRGNPSTHQEIWSIVRSIPAWAGKPLDSPGTLRGRRVYPRVGGETKNTFISSL